MFYRFGAICRLLAALAVLTLVAAFFTLAAAAQSVTWKKLSPKNAPSARAASAMAYDPVSKKIVLLADSMQLPIRKRRGRSMERHGASRRRRWRLPGVLGLRWLLTG